MKSLAVEEENFEWVKRNGEKAAVRNSREYAGISVYDT